MCGTQTRLSAIYTTLGPRRAYVSATARIGPQFFFGSQFSTCHLNIRPWSIYLLMTPSAAGAPLNTRGWHRTAG